MRKTTQWASTGVSLNTTQWASTRVSLNTTQWASSGVSLNTAQWARIGGQVIFDDLLVLQFESSEGPVPSKGPGC